jgi:hypothetical protein
MPGVVRTKAAMLVLSSLALSVPFALVVKAQAALAESAVSPALAALLALTSHLSPVSPAAARVDEAEAQPLLEAATAAGGSSAGKPSGKRSARAVVASKPRPLFVSAASVLELAKSAVRPRGSFVAQTPQHPAGLRLVGVGALGIGVQDGDILIDAMGMAPRSSGELIGAIIEARARRVRTLSGTLWRSGQTFAITVEQPYLDPA